MQTSKSHPTYNDIHAACLDIAVQSRIRCVKFDVIIGVSRGGLIPATILSHRLSVPLIPISYSAISGKGDDRNHDNILPIVDSKSILIVDDICDSGYTLRELVDHYSNENTIVYTAVTHFKLLDNPIIIPDFYWVSVSEETDGWIHFPWEWTDE